MSFIDKLSNSVSDTAKSLTKKSNDLIEVSKLKNSIRKREEEIQNLLEEMGQYVYVRLKQQNYITKDEMGTFVLKIEKLQEEIKNLDKLILNIKQIQYCENCRIELEDDNKYCPLCGNHIGR